MQPLTRIQRLCLIILLSSLFFTLEITIGFRQHSLALVADAFHVASDLISFGVALYATQKGGEVGPGVKRGFSFGYQRAELVRLHAILHPVCTPRVKQWWNS